MMGIKRRLLNKFWHLLLELNSNIRPPIKLIDASFIDVVYQKEKRQQNKVVDKVMSFSVDGEDFITEEERAYPGNPMFIKNKHSETMLKRYFFAGKYFCENKKVLDSCSGLGWGSYILSNYSQELTAFDLSKEVIDYSKTEWGEKINWKKGNALDLSFLNNEKFDVAIAMETIEHFSKENGELYIKELANSLVQGGVLVGSSAFPRTREQADTLCSTNPYHLYVFTKREMELLLSKYFQKYHIVNRWMFFAFK